MLAMSIKLFFINQTNLVEYMSDVRNVNKYENLYIAEMLI